MITVQVQGADKLHRALRPLLEPEITQTMEASLKDGAKLYAKELRSESKPASKRMSRAVRYYKAKRDKPGYVVGYKRKTAFFTHWVIGGTKDHGPRKAEVLWFVPNWNPYFPEGSPAYGSGRWRRAARVRGVRANPIVDRVAQRVEQRAAGAVEDKFVKETGL